MSRSLGVADSKADIDEGTVTGLSRLSTATGSSVGFYGKVPVVQRPYSSALHATSGISSSADFGATQLAWAQEVQNTLIGLGVWATA